jgi:hypothetical protein
LEKELILGETTNIRPWTVWDIRRGISDQFVSVFQSECGFGKTNVANDLPLTVPREHFENSKDEK